MRRTEEITLRLDPFPFELGDAFLLKIGVPAFRIFLPTAVVRI